MTMRVTIVTGEFTPDRGGVADYSFCLGKALADRGIDVNILTRKRPGVDRKGWPVVEGEEEAASGGYATVAPRDDRIRIFRVSGVWGWSLGAGMQRLSALTRPDVIHLQYQTAAYGMHPGVNVAPIWVRATVAARFAVTYHDLLVPYLFPKAGRLRQTVTLLPARCANLTIATNPDDYLSLKLYGKARRLELVPIGSNIADSPPDDYDRGQWRMSHGVQAGEELIGYFGMLNESKGARTLVQALGHLRDSGRPARLVMIGATVGTSDPTNEVYRAAVRTEIEALGLADRVLWTGHLPSPAVSAWLRSVDAVALPYADGASYRRGSLMAAFEHACPIVTTQPPNVRQWRGTGIPELRNGEGVMLVPPGDSQALARALAAVLRSPEVAKRLSDAARELSSHFAWETIAERHEALYRETIGTPEALMPEL